MKKYICLLAILLSLGCAETSTQTEQIAIDQITIDTTNKSDIAFIVFNNTTQSFGTINKSKNATKSLSFRFKNTGGTPLVLNKVDVSCNCVSVEFPKKPILSGEDGVITAKIDAKNQEGVIIKQIIVKSNARNNYVLLKITGNIQ